MGFAENIIDAIKAEPDRQKQVELASSALDALSKLHAELTHDRARMAKLAYNREWRRRNKEKVAAYAAKYWAKKGAAK